MFTPGPKNLITDVAGLTVGNVAGARLKSGVTAVICEEATTAAVQVLGGAPGTRETDALEPHTITDAVHAVVLSGGSAFGLDAASGVQAWLRERGRGFELRGHRVPVVPAAILFDLPNGGDKDWGRYPPYREMGYRAADGAGAGFDLGTEGAGAGATTAGLKGGLGSASVVLDNGVTVAALVAANAAGSVTVGRGAHFWAAPFEIDGEFGGLGLPSPMPADAQDIILKSGAGSGGNTTIGVIATDARLTKASAKRLAIAAHDGLARAVWPVHTAVDGDLFFALATSTREAEIGIEDGISMHAAATAVTARAVARAVFSAVAEDGDHFPVWSARWGP